MVLKASLFPNICGIYCIKNLLNNKVYIGSSINMQKRIRKHIGTLRSNSHDNKHLQHAYNKYKEENFEILILASVINVTLIKEIEEYFIELNKSYNRSFGYNNSKTATRCTHIEESKQLIRLRNLGKKYSAEINAKKGHKGKDNPFYGKKQTFSNIKKMIINKGYKFAPFICIETGEIFNWFTDAARKTGCRVATISECVKHQRLKRCVGKGNCFHFIYIEELPFKIVNKNNIAILTNEQKALIIKEIDPTRKMFKCIETNEVFNSVKKASLHFKIRRTSISDQLIGKRKSNINGYNFVYI